MEFSIASKSFYSNSGNKSIRKPQAYLTPLERKAIRDIKKIKLENNLADNETPMKIKKRKGSDVKPRKTSTHRKLPLCDSQTDNMKRPSFISKSPKPMSERRSTYSWAPKSLNKKFLKNQSALKGVVLPPLHSMSLPCLHVSKVKDARVTAADKTFSSYKSDDDQLLDSPAKIRKLEATHIGCREADSSLAVEDRENEAKISRQCESTTRGAVEGKVFPIFNKVSSRPKKIAHKLPALLPAETSTKITKLSSKIRSSSSTSRQLVIDAGQKRFGATQCSICSMVFSASHPADEHDHFLHHKRFLSAIKFCGWKNERVVATFMDGRIIKVTSADQQYALKKVADMLVIVDVDLGFKTPNSGISESKVVYFFISDSDKIVGCLVAEKISHGYQLMPQKDQSNESNPLHFTSTESSPAMCGVSRVWTYAPMRRKKIATRLVDTLKKSFVLGMELESNQIAFSSPTPDGLRFATSYFQVPNILVYNFLR